MISRCVLRAILLTAIAVGFGGMFARAASAQLAVATLAGRVVDTQLAATPGASVTVRSLATSTTWTASSDDNGRFSFPMLPPGVYGVEVSLSGFVPWRAEAVTLQVGQDRQLDVQLYLGNFQEGVVVRGDTRPVSTVVDGVLPAARIESLPLNGRNFLELALLIPGNAPTPVFDPTKTNSVLIASAGQTGTRRQHHHRRPGQQRRRGRRTAAESAD